MRSSSEASSSPSCRSKKPSNLRSSEKTVSSDQVTLSTKTPDKPPELTRPNTRRTRNRGVALSLSEVRKVAESLQDRRDPETTPFRGKTVRRALHSPCKPKRTSANEPFKLPQKYEILGEFFDSLDSSIRLLRLKGSMTSFSNISPKIECLTDRRFTHGHLAQLKFLLPEAIEIKKVLLFDERTSCMKPDLHVTINPDAVESDAKSAPECGSRMSLRKMFRSRLIDFCKSHPEGNEIPEEILPEPFNRPKQDQLSDILRRPSSSFATETSSSADAALHSTVSSAVMQDNVTSDNVKLTNGEDSSVSVRTSIESLNQKPAEASHMSKSFRRRFSLKPKEHEADLAQKKLPSDSFQSLVSEKEPISVGRRSDPNAIPTNLSSEVASSEVCPTVFASSGAPPATPSKTIDKDGPLKDIGAVSTPAKLDSTPAKLASTPARLMSATPALPPPKRSLMSPDDTSSHSPNKLARRPPRSKLKFDTPLKNKETENEDDDGALSIGDDVFDILPESLLQSIREKEIKAMEERSPAISQAKRRQKMIARLPKLFNMIHLLFQSVNRSVITKEELVSKIIAGHCDIVDRREVEEQLNLLLEIVPEWISEKLTSSGDFLFCINKVVDAQAIRTTLEEAK